MEGYRDYDKKYFSYATEGVAVSYKFPYFMRVSIY